MSSSPAGLIHVIASNVLSISPRKKDRNKISAQQKRKQRNRKISETEHNHINRIVAGCFCPAQARHDIKNYMFKIEDGQGCDDESQRQQRNERYFNPSQLREAP